MHWKMGMGTASLSDVMQRVRSLRDQTSKFPKYCIAGYSFRNDVLNNSGFSAKILKSYGIPIGPRLEKYIGYAYTRGFWGWAQNYNPVTFIASALNENIGIRSLMTYDIICDLLKYNNSENRPEEIVDFKIARETLRKVYGDKPEFQ